MLRWLVFVVLLTIIFGTLYVSIQQVLRQSANDPQIALSEDLAQNRSQRSDGSTLELGGPTVDIRSSLQPFIMEFNDKGVLQQTNLNLEEFYRDTKQIVTVPPGVFEYTRNHKQDRFTWQPFSNVRIATVVTYFKGKSSGFVLVGRSLREVEAREENMMKLVGLGWAGAVSVLTLFSFLQNAKQFRKK